MTLDRWSYHRLGWSYHLDEGAPEMTTTAQVVDDIEQRVMQIVRDANAGTEMTQDQFAAAVARTAAVAFPAVTAEMAAAGRPDLAARVMHEVAARAAQAA